MSELQNLSGLMGSIAGAKDRAERGIKEASSQGVADELTQASKDLDKAALDVAMAILKAARNL